ncbi:MAG: DUF4412 domain-containing protein [Bacteroidales bacterium]|nr:DUF4412 domain-containing protein [Bacteroidales bacterium]
MKTIFKLMCVAMALLVAFSVNAQKKEKTFAGSIKYAITYENLDPQYKGQVPTEMVLYVKDGKIRQDQVSPMYTMSAISLEDGSAIILIDVMGQKLATQQSKEDVEKAKAEAKESGELKDEEPVVKVTDETKTIAGYKCTKVEVTTADGETMEVFVTEEIPMPANYSDSNPVKGIKGVPMEYSMASQGMNMTMTAKEVKKGGVNNGMFVISDDYQKLSAEEFAKMLGGGM